MYFASHGRELRSELSPALIHINANIDLNSVETVMCCLKKDAVLPILLQASFFAVFWSFSLLPKILYSNNDCL